MRVALSSLFILIIFLSAARMSAAQAAGSELVGATSRISEFTASLGGAPVGGNGPSTRSSLSPSGSILAFESLASNLTANDLNGEADVFVSLLKNNKIFKTSVGRKALAGNGASFDPCISAATPNGSYLVAFTSDAQNLGRRKNFPDNNGVSDIYASLLPNRITFRVTRSPSGALANGESSNPDVTLLAEPNRLFVVYRSKATNLTTDDSNTFSDIYLSQVTAKKDLKDGESLEDGIKTVRISKAANGNETDGDSSNPKISGDGRFIVFESEATNLISGLTSIGKQIFLYDIQNKSTSLISKTLSGMPSNANSRGPSISYDGRYITYISNSTDLIDDSKVTTKNIFQVFRYDRQLQSTERVNTSSSGTAGNGSSLAILSARLEASGRFVIFSDRADNLIPNDNNSAVDVFIKDMALGTLERVSQTPSGGDPDQFSFAPAINRSDFTATTGLATFSSGATTLVDHDSEGIVDLFLTQLRFPPLPLSPATRLSVPPSITLSGQKANLTFEKFDGVLSPLSRLSLISARDEITPNTKLQYRISYTREAAEGIKKETKRVTSKKISLTLKNLKPGTYTTSYQVQTVKGKKVIRQTPNSPAQRFSISE